MNEFCFVDSPIGVLELEAESNFISRIKFKKGKFFTINFNLINRKILKNKSLFSNPTLHAEKLKYSNRITLNKLYYIDKGIFSFLIKVNKLN